MDETDIDPNYQRPTHIDQLGLNHKPIKLSQEIIAKMNAATANGTKNYHKAYTIIADYLERTESGPKELIFWFRKAAEINRNDKGAPSNAAIRGGNEEAAEIDGREMSAAYQQKLSDDIGSSVIQRLKKGYIPNLYTITQVDALKTVKVLSGKDKPVDISNWVGAAWSWNIPITIDGKTKTIGEFISSDPKKLEKFIQVQAYAAHAAVDSGAVDRLGDAFEMLKMRHDPIMGPPEHIRERIEKAYKAIIPKNSNDYFFPHDFDDNREKPRRKQAQTRLRRELPHDANDPYAELNFGKSEKISTRHKALEKNPENLNQLNRVQLAKPRLKPAPEALPKKGPERVKHDPSYNPYDREANGFEDLEGEAFLFKTDKNRNARSIIASGRQKMFKDFFKDIILSNTHFFTPH